MQAVANAEWAAGFCWTEMGCRSPGAPTGLRFLTQRVHHRAGKGASWSTHSVLGRLRKSFVCLRAHRALKQTLDSRQPLGRLERPLRVANIAFPGRNPAGSAPMRLLRLLPSPHCFRDSLYSNTFSPHLGASI